jgi:hypothetical protein
VRTEEINDWLGVLTNIGVIVGLVFVAYEIHQNSLSLETEARISRIEVYDATREAWQSWHLAIVENRDVADLWLRGKAGEPLDPVDAHRFELLARQLFMLIAQNYRQFSTMTEEPADWAIQQLAEVARQSPRLKQIFMAELERIDRQGTSSSYAPFNRRVKELDLPEFR